MVMQTSCKKGMEQMDLLQAFEIIVDKAKGSSLGEKFYQEADPYLGFVSDKLCISKRASAIMALFADRCDDNHIQFSDYTDFWIAESLACFDIPRRQRNLLTRNMSAGVRMKVFTIASPWR